ncbi:hypothetical protein B0H10DRAFT_2218176 [Mycena sp. CBHHK59/15]|nr:hypothetical protein B0H10DRAFT_2218176 [Mycena sp. CBHHK59/15]
MELDTKSPNDPESTSARMGSPLMRTTITSGLATTRLVTRGVEANELALHGELRLIEHRAEERSLEGTSPAVACGVLPQKPPDLAANAERLILRASMQDNKHHRIHEQKKALKESNSGPDVQTEKAKDAFARKRKALEVAATAPVNLRLSATSRYTNPLPNRSQGEELAEAAGEPLRALVDLPTTSISSARFETVAPKGKIDAAPGQTAIYTSPALLSIYG